MATPDQETPVPPTKLCPHCSVQSQTFDEKCPNCGKPYGQKKKRGCLKWLGIALIVLIAVIAGCAALLASGTGEDVGDVPGAVDGADQDAADEPEGDDASGIGDGTHHVGDDIAPGIYMSTGDGTCYWARLAGFSGELDDVRANGNNAPEIVAIAEDDAAFETQGCGEWVPAAETAPPSPANEFGDGTYQVGRHIQPGTYRADGDGTCYWARLSNFSHAGVDGIVTNGNSPTTIEIAPTDAGFTTSGCGTWTAVG